MVQARSARKRAVRQPVVAAALASHPEHESQPQPQAEVEPELEPTSNDAHDEHQDEEQQDEMDQEETLHDNTNSLDQETQPDTLSSGTKGRAKRRRRRDELDESIIKTKDKGKRRKEHRKEKATDGMEPDAAADEVAAFMTQVAENSNSNNNNGNGANQTSTESPIEAEKSNEIVDSVPRDTQTQNDSSAIPTPTLSLGDTTQASVSTTAIAYAFAAIPPPAHTDTNILQDTIAVPTPMDSMNGNIEAVSRKKPPRGKKANQSGGPSVQETGIWMNSNAAENHNDTAGNTSNNGPPTVTENNSNSTIPNANGQIQPGQALDTRELDNSAPTEEHDGQGDDDHDDDDDDDDDDDENHTKQQEPTLLDVRTQSIGELIKNIRKCEGMVRMPSTVSARLSRKEAKQAARAAEKAALAGTDDNELNENPQGNAAAAAIAPTDAAEHGPTVARSDMIAKDVDISSDDDDDDSSMGGSVIAPQVNIDEHGNIVVDKASLEITAGAVPSADMELEGNALPTVGAMRVTSASFSRREKGQRWTEEETHRFYEGLKKFGTDFSLMESMFPTRSRRQLKLKYTREEKQSPHRIESALSCRDTKLEHVDVQRILESAESAKKKKTGVNA